MRYADSLARLFLPVALKLLYRSLRIDIAGKPANLPERGSLFMFWHGKMVIGWLLARQLYPGRKVTAIVSMSADGSLLASALERLNFSLIRGSSSKGSAAVRQEMAERLGAQDVVALTPDGPKGPVYSIKPGSIRLAAAQQVPVLFASISCRNRWQLRSWDYFEIPKPFSIINVQLHMLDLPEFSDDDTLKSWTAALSERFSNSNA